MEKNACNTCIGKNSCGAKPGGDICNRHYTPKFDVDNIIEEIKKTHEPITQSSIWAELDRQIAVETGNYSKN